MAKLNTPFISGNRKKIGIITGAGPEAGIDLWQKLLDANKRQLGPAFQGDLDAPNVTVFSIPELGLATDLPNNVELLWETISKAIIDIDKRADIICIACNVLHYFSDKIRQLNITAEFISIVDTAVEYIHNNHIDRLALLSIGTVMKLDDWSPYQSLKNVVEVETPADFTAVDQLISEIKRSSSTQETLRTQFSGILSQLDSDTVFLACTELPLVMNPDTSKKLVDVTGILAEHVIRRLYN